MRCGCDPFFVYAGDPAHGISSVMNFTTLGAMGAMGAKPLRIGIWGDLGEADCAARKHARTPSCIHLFI